jgi:hypothetical protein
MAFKFNPFTGTLDEVSTGGGGGTPGGSNTQIQFNDSSAFGGDADLVWNKTTNVLGVTGDVNLIDGGSFTTTLQTITPTAARTISLPDSTGTVALVAGSSGQLLWNNAGVNAGASTLTYDGSILTTSGRFINSYSSVSLAPAKAFTGTWATGFGATNTKPHLLIEPTGASSGAWSPNGTGLGVNAASGFTGNVLDLQVNGTSRASVNSAGTGIFNSSNSFADLTGSTSNANSGIKLIGQGGRLTGNADTLLSWDFTRVAVTQLGFGPTASGANISSDVILARDAANTLAQRNGANAQTSRIYNTFTDASNYQRTSLTDSSTGLVIDQQFAGTGVVRTNLLDLQVNGSSRFTVAQTTTNIRSADIGDVRLNLFHNTNTNSLAFYYNGGVAFMGTPTGSPLVFIQNNVNRFEIASSLITAAIPLTVATGNALTANHRLTGTAPATASSTGTAGDVRYDTDYVYICTATNTWKRAALTTW